jgi:chromosome segregation ATPase
MTKSSEDAQSPVEQDLEASRERLRDTERKAEQQVEAAERLAARAAELEEREAELRRKMHEPQGPLLPPAPETSRAAQEDG